MPERYLVCSVARFDVGSNAGMIWVPVTMPASGQGAKCSSRVDVVRFAYEFEHCLIRATLRICAHKPTSLERPETNTLSVGAHPRDGESVEAKGMPKVK